MEKRKKQRNPRQPQKESAAQRECRRCVFNEYKRCGIMFCILPRCKNDVCARHGT